MADRTGLWGASLRPTLRVIRIKRGYSKSFLTFLSNRSNPVYAPKHGAYALSGIEDQKDLNMADRTGLFGLPALTLRVIRIKRGCSKSFLTILPNRSNPVYAPEHGAYALSGTEDQKD